jgi:hypothetical protein
MVIDDVDGNVFRGYTPVVWESPKVFCHKIDEVAKSFLFTLKNPHNVPAQQFRLKEEEKWRAINCFRWRGRAFGHGCDLFVPHNWDSTADSVSNLGRAYIDNASLNGRIFFAGAADCTVKEIEVFEVSDDHSSLRRLK